MMQQIVALFRALRDRDAQEASTEAKLVKLDGRVAVSTPLGSLVLFGGWSKSNSNQDSDQDVNQDSDQDSDRVVNQDSDQDQQGTLKQSLTQDFKHGLRRGFKQRSKQEVKQKVKRKVMQQVKQGVSSMVCSVYNTVGVLSVWEGRAKVYLASPSLQIEKAVLAPAESVKTMTDGCAYLALLDKQGNVWVLSKNSAELEPVARQAQDVCLMGGSFIAVLARKHVLVVDILGVEPCLITEVGPTTGICANTFDKRVFCTNKSTICSLDYHTNSSTSTDLGFIATCTACSKTCLVVLDTMSMTVLDQADLAIQARIALPNLARASFYLSSVGDVLACQNSKSDQTTSLVFSRQEIDQLELHKLESRHT